MLENGEDYQHQPCQHLPPPQRSELFPTGVRYSIINPIFVTTSGQSTTTTINYIGNGGANVGTGSVLLPKDYEGNDEVIDLRLRL